MSRLIEWFAAERWRLSLSHCLEGLLIQIPVWIFFGPRVSVLAVVVWYWSRKKLEAEEDCGHAADPASTWAIGWWPWTWGWYRQLDLYLPAASSLILAALVAAFF